MHRIHLTTIIVLACLLSSCSFVLDPPGPNNKNSLVFIGSYFTDSKTPDYLAKFDVDLQSGQVEISELTNMISKDYLYWSTYYNGTLRNNRYAYVANSTNFADNKAHVLYFDLDGEFVTQLPEPLIYGKEKLIPKARNVSPKIDNKGRIFYCIWYSPEYGDLHRPTIFRYNVETETYEYTKGIDAFIATQPEIGDDSENGAIYESFEISLDGKYAYTSVYGYGTSGGAYHQDYFFVIQYNFETDEITRLDGGIKGGAIVKGISSDGSKIYYTLGTNQKYYNLNTNVDSEINTVFPWSVTPQLAFNSVGNLEAKTTGIYYNNIETREQLKIVKSYGTTSPQFDDDGNVYFILESESNNYICKKIGLDVATNASWDTIASIPRKVNYLVLVK